MPLDGTELSDAAKAVILLDMVEVKFQGGKRWGRMNYVYRKRWCILGALKDASSGSCISSHTTIAYLLRAIDPRWKFAEEYPRIWHDAVATFNDVTARNYGDIKKLLKLARYYAVADWK
jgi:hypothetical protein